jgi:hypothetical protein
MPGRCSCWIPASWKRITATIPQLILQAPALMPATASGERPVHFNMDAARVAVFWDGTGAATLHDAAAAATGDLAPIMTIETGAPHHGVAVPVGDFTIATVAPEGEGLPDVLAVLGPDGAELSRVDCLNLHGEGKAGGFIAVGCEDGVAIFDTSVTPPAGRFVSYPDEVPAEGMIRQLLGPRDTMALVGNWGADAHGDLRSLLGDGRFRLRGIPRARGWPGRSTRPAWRGSRCWPTGGSCGSPRITGRILSRGGRRDRGLFDGAGRDPTNDGGRRSPRGRLRPCRGAGRHGRC